MSKTGGHLSSNLGTVELTIALHYVFNTPDDRIVWDVGHQTYPHKILTGRRDRMHTLRQLGGISGFPRRDESEYDTFGTAHSSTSISAALGMALAARTKGENRHAIAVIGDGAMTAGMAFEALNNAGVHDDINLLVILNDNDMSISPPVGALEPLPRAPDVGPVLCRRARTSASRCCPGPMLELAKRLEEHAKGMVVPATMFEEFGFNYIGPIDGHDLDSLIPTLQNLKQLKGPQFLHVVTKKGQGYKLAEADPVLYHGPGKFNPAEGIKPAAAGKMTYTAGVRRLAVRHGRSRTSAWSASRRPCAKARAWCEFEQRFPDRYYDVGIAEQHAVTFAAGLACEGLKPVVAIYSTFLQRAYDQLIHDVALQNLDVTFALDRAGLVGADGATHAGNYDMALPALHPQHGGDGRVGRKRMPADAVHRLPVPRPGRGALSARRRRRRGDRNGPEHDPDGQGRGAPQRQAGRHPRFRHHARAGADSRRRTQCDGRQHALRQAAGRGTGQAACRRATICLVTVEEGCIMGGAGSAVAEALAAAGIVKPMLQLGLPDRFIDHGDAAQLLATCGLDAAGIAASIRQRFGKGEPRLVVNNQ